MVTKTSKDLTLLRRMRLFQSLTLQELKMIAGILRTKKCAKNKRIIEEGSPGGSLFLVKSGRFKVSHVVRGKARVLGTFGVGDHFGEIAFIDQLPRSATIFATEDSDLLVLPRKSYERLVGAAPQLKIKFMQNLLADLCDKLRKRVNSLDFELSDLLPVCIFEMDLKGDLTFVNRSGLDSLQLSAADFEQGINLFDLVEPGSARKAQSFVRKTLKSGKATIEFEILKKDGTILPVLGRAEPLRSSARIHGIRATLVDISERRRSARLQEMIEEQRRAEKKNRELADQLRKSQMLEAMGRLVSGVAHEVRNPLNAIQATTVLLQQELGSNENCKQFLDIVRAQVRRLSDLMRELLELGRPVDASRMNTQSLQQLCSAAIQLWLQNEPNQLFRVTLAPAEQDLQGNVDNARIQQVIINLLDNAAAHSPKGSEIGLSLCSDSDHAIIRIKDQGAGVEPQIISRLFEPFFTTRRGGTGLGLSIVKHTIEAHNGRVALYNNDPAPGCTVEIALPLMEAL